MSRKRRQLPPRSSFENFPLFQNDSSISHDGQSGLLENSVKVVCLTTKDVRDAGQRRDRLVKLILEHAETLNW
jgi:hypothetical protein